MQRARKVALEFASRKSCKAHPKRHVQWCAGALLVVLASGLPLSHGERATVVRLLRAPAAQLPPVWSSVMFGEVTDGLG